jgi:hypothetical protein
VFQRVGYRVASYLGLYHDAKRRCGGLCADGNGAQWPSKVQKAILFSHAGQDGVAVGM